MGENDSSVAYSSLERFSNASYLLPKLTPEDSEGGGTGGGFLHRDGQISSHRLISDLSDASECLRYAYDRHQISRTNLITALMDLKDPVLTALANRCLNLTIPDPSGGPIVETDQTPRRRGVAPQAQFTAHPPSERGSRNKDPLPSTTTAASPNPVTTNCVDEYPEPHPPQPRVLTEPAAINAQISPHPISPPARRNGCAQQRAKTPPPDPGSARASGLVSVECASPPAPNQLSWYAKPRGIQRRKPETASPSVASVKYPQQYTPQQRLGLPKITTQRGFHHREMIISDRPMTQSTVPTESAADARGLRRAGPAGRGTPSSLKLREPQTLGNDLRVFSTESSSLAKSHEATPPSARPPLLSRPPAALNTPAPDSKYSVESERGSHYLVSPSPASETPTPIRRRETVTIRHHQQESPTRLVRSPTPQQPPPPPLPPAPPVTSVKSAPLPADVMSNVSSEAGCVTSIIQRFESSSAKAALPPSGKMGAGPGGDLRKSFREKLDAFRAMERQLSNDSFTLSAKPPPIRKMNTATTIGMPSSGMRHPSGALTSRRCPTQRKSDVLRKVDGKIVEAVRACHTFYDAHNAVKEIAQEAGDLIRLVDSQGNVICSQDLADHQSSDTTTSSRSTATASSTLPSSFYGDSLPDTPLSTSSPRGCLMHWGSDPYQELRLLLQKNSSSYAATHQPPPLQLATPAPASLMQKVKSALFPGASTPPPPDGGLRNALTSGLHRNCCPQSSPPVAPAEYTLSHIDTLGLLAILHQQQLLIQTLAATTIDTAELLQELDSSEAEPALPLSTISLMEGLKKKI